MERTYYFATHEVPVVFIDEVELFPSGRGGDATRMHGRPRHHPYLPDGERIITSRIEGWHSPGSDPILHEAYGIVAKTLNTIYVIGINLPRERREQMIW